MLFIQIDTNKELINQLSTLNNSNILSGIITGLIILLIVFVFFRPWFYISKKISVSDGVFRFKVINFTLIKCTEIDFYLRQVSEIDAYPKGKDVIHELIPINTKSFIYVPGLIRGLLNSHRPNCLQVKCTNKDLSQIVEADNTYLELIIKARHGISNLQTTKKRQ
jgi:hypothetical protein